MDEGRRVSEAVVPHNLDAERAVLGALLLAGGLGIDETRAVLDRIRDEGLEAGSFYWVERHGALFDTIAAVVDRDEPADAMIVVEELRRRDCLQSVGGETAIIELVGLASTTRNAGHHARL